MNTNKELHSAVCCRRSIASLKAIVRSRNKCSVRLGEFVFIRVHSWFWVAWLGFGLLFALPAAFAETADDIFHGGVVNYLSNNIPKALEVVTNGRALFPDDTKLKKLEELLKQQDQQQQQQEQQQKDEQKKEEEKKDQQSKQDQKDEQKKQEQSKEDQQKQEQQQEKTNADDEEQKEQKPADAHAMTPQEAQKLLDAQKGDEKVLQLVPEGEPKNRDRAFKDW
jgi:hypothetical protein